MTPSVSTATAGIRVDSPLQGRAAFSADGAFFGSVARSLDGALNQLVIGTGQVLVNGKPAPSPAMNEATALAVLKNNMSQIANPATGTLSADDLLQVAMASAPVACRRLGKSWNRSRARHDSFCITRRPSCHSTRPTGGCMRTRQRPGRTA